MSFATAYATKKRNAKCMAKGGEVKDHAKGVHKQSIFSENPGVSSAGKMVRNSKDKDIDKHSRGMSGLAAKFKHQDVMEEQKSMPKPKLPMAEGGMVDEEDHDDMDMVGRIMQRYSRGGQVANDVGVSEADELPAEYDDLVLRDDLESHYDAEDSGDMDGDAAQDARDADVVARVLASRRKKDRMPRPA